MKTVYSGLRKLVNNNKNHFQILVAGCGDLGEFPMVSLLRKPHSQGSLTQCPRDSQILQFFSMYGEKIQEGNANSPSASHDPHVNLPCLGNLLDPDHLPDSVRNYTIYHAEGRVCNMPADLWRALVSNFKRRSTYYVCIWSSKVTHHEEKGHLLELSHIRD